MTRPAVLCPQCSSTVSDGEEFCPVCGDFLGWRGDLVVPDLVVVDEPADRPEEVDPLAQYRQARAVAEERAAAAQSDAVKAQVRLERTRRRGASARRRLERLQAELPAAEQRVRDAVTAAERAAAGARRAKSAADAAQATPGPRRDELRKRARDAGKAETRARAATLQAQEALSTLSGVLQGVRAEVATFPAETSSAQRARDAARAEATAARTEAAAAAAELALQERLLQLRATPRRIVPAEDAERTLREQAQQEADEAARDAERRAGAAERRQRRRAELEDERRDQAEQQSDARELSEVLAGAGQAERAAAAAERAVQRVSVPEPAAQPDATEVLDTGLLAADDDRVQPAALPPSEVRRRVRRQAVPLVLPDDGPVACPACAAGNPTGRHLCRVCGAVLLAAAPPPPPPSPSWWRRLLRLEPRPVRAKPFVPAGARPVPGGNRRTAAAVRRARVGGASALRGAPGPTRGVLVAAVLVLAAALAVVLTPLGGSLVDAAAGGGEQVRRVAYVETPLVPLSTRASSTGLTSAPALAVDGDPITSWTPETAPGSGADLGLSLVRPADLVAVRLTPAAGTGRPRPASVSVHAPGQVPVVLRLRDSLQPQRFDLQLTGVTDVQIRLDDLYPGAEGLAAGLAEVELLVLSPRSEPQR